jgi:uncharacterized protein (DUF697 family)
MSSTAKSWLAARMTGGISKGLLAAYQQMLVHPDAYLVQLQRAHRLPIRDYEDLFAVPTPLLDSIARETVNAATKMAAAEGAGFGLFGIFALVPDMAVLATICVQMMQKLSLIYGFEISTDEERANLWIAAASAFGLDLGKEFLEKEVLERVVPEIILRLSGRLGAEFAEKAAAKAIPILSSAIGGALNYFFVRHWGEKVAAHFREKHLAIRTQPALPHSDLPQLTSPSAQA